MSKLSALALSLIASGYSVIPIQTTSKKPSISAWLPYQSITMDTRTAEREFLDGRQIAVITGSVSGNLELIDFDTDKDGKCPHFGQWWKMLKDNGHDELLKALTVAKTPSGGRHVFYKCHDGIGSNQPLAKVKADEPPIIETRGEGGYALIYPSPGYIWAQGDLDSVPKISAEQRDILIHASTMFDELPAKAEPPPRKAPRLEGVTYVGEEEPWTAYNRQTDMKDLLEREGWQYVGMIGKREKWRRPGKDRGEHSATVTTIGDQVLYPFTTSTIFQSRKGLDCFGVYTMLRHGGNFAEATKAVRVELGMNDRKPVTRPLYGHGAPAPVPVFTDEAIRNGFAFEDIEDFDYQPPTFGVFGQFLRSGQINLLDAPESIGKTKMVLKWAANMSNGWCDYYDVEIPQKKTLIFTVEDDGGDLHESFRECKGQEGYLKIYREVVDLRGDELKRLEATIRDNDFGLVVFDPLLSYMHGVSDINSAKAVNEYLVPIRKVAMDTGACIVNIRHFNKSTFEVPRNRRAGGSVQFNSCHRSQIVIDWHTERKGVRVCTHERASNRVKKIEAPFGWDINSSGLIEWIYDTDMLEEGRGK